jgi:glycosyltransferase involved in cell wall biosynthesis
LPRRPFDIVHLAHTTFPEDPRPRREAMIAAETGARVAIIVVGGGRDGRRVSRYGRIRVVRLEGRRRRGSVGHYLFEYLDFLLKARWLIRKDNRFGRAKIFHVHTLPDFLVGATRNARRSGARIILDLHEVFPEFTRSKFAGWKGAVGALIAKRLERWSRQQADVLLTVNHAVAEQLAARPAKPGERILVIHNFADPGEFGPAGLTPGRSRSPVRLVYHGTLTRLYGLDLAIEGVALARSRGRDVEFDVFGDGPAREELEQQIDRLGLSGKVQLRGPAPHQVLKDLLPQYDAGLVPTRLDVMTRFSLSTKLLEYIHLGLPVIVPAIPTYLRYFPGNTAWYFEPDSPPAIAGAIEAFASATPEERIRRASEAQAVSTEKLDPARDATLLRNLYLELLGPAPAR